MVCCGLLCPCLLLIQIGGLNDAFLGLDEDPNDDLSSLTGLQTGLQNVIRILREGCEYETMLEEQTGSAREIAKRAVFDLADGEKLLAKSREELAEVTGRCNKLAQDVQAAGKLAEESVGGKLLDAAATIQDLQAKLQQETEAKTAALSQLEAERIRADTAVK